MIDEGFDNNNNKGPYSNMGLYQYRSRIRRYPHNPTSSSTASQKQKLSIVHSRQAMQSDPHIPYTHTLSLCLSLSVCTVLHFIITTSPILQDSHPLPTSYSPPSASCHPPIPPEPTSHIAWCSNTTSDVSAIHGPAHPTGPNTAQT